MRCRSESNAHKKKVKRQRLQLHSCSSPKTISCGRLFVTDPGADIDDETALLAAMKEQQKNPDGTMGICIGGGTGGNIKAWLDFCAKVGISEEEVNKSFIFMFDRSPDTKSQSGEITEGRLHIPHDVVIRPKKIYVLAPGIDQLWNSNYLDLSELEKVVFQGNLPFRMSMSIDTDFCIDCPVADYTAAVNDINSEIFLKNLPMGTLVRCVTSKECYLPKNLFSNEMFEEFNLSSDVVRQIQEKSFTLLIGRIDPTISLAAFIGESLINKEIKGGNYIFVKAAFEKAMSDGNYNVQPQQSTARLVSAVTLYMSELCDTCEKMNKPLQNYTVTQNYLLEMCYMITALIGEEPLTASGKLITSNDDTDVPALYPVGFENFIKLGVYTPAYDFAAVQAG